MTDEAKETSADETMVERVARAMLVARGFTEGTIAAHRKEGTHLWVGTLKEARASFTAMREPSEAMLNAARDWSIAKYGVGVGNDGATGCWQAMIDVALSEGGER